MTVHAARMAVDVQRMSILILFVSILFAACAPAPSDPLEERLAPPARDPRAKNTLRLSQLALPDSTESGGSDRGFTLQGLDLSGQDWSRIDAAYSRLMNANLSGANLESANLAKADMTEAQLRGVQLSRANLSRSILVDADLTGAQLVATNLIGADLRNADLEKTNLEGAYIAYADFRGAQHLTPQQLETAYWPAGNEPILDPGVRPTAVRKGMEPLEGNLRGPHLAGADLSDQNMTDANLRGSDLSGAILRNARLTGADLEGAVLRGSELTGADLFEARGLTAAQLQDAFWDETNPPRLSNSLLVQLSPELDGAREPIANLVKETFVIDGVLSYTVKQDPKCKRDCRTERYAIAGIPEATGVDVAIMTISREVERVRHYGSLIDETQGARVIRTRSDLQQVRANREYGVILYTQQVPMIHGDPKRVREWFEAGLRIVQPAYSSNLPAWELRAENKLAGGADEPSQGLTVLGRKVIEELLALGMIIDVSHCSEKTTFDIIQMADVPIMANHANAKALTLAARGPYLLGRNKSDRELRAIAQTGGVVGITTVAWMLDRDGDGKADIDDFMAHLDYMVNLVGENHVGIASDSSLDGWGVEEIHYSDAVLASMDRWRVVARRMRQDLGYTDHRIRKVLGGNFQRMLERMLPE